MNRRELLKLLLSGAAGYALDVDRLLWVPGVKKIFIPSGNISISSIVDIELKRITPKMISLFERDDTFYRTMKNQKSPLVSSRLMRIPLSLEDRK